MHDTDSAQERSLKMVLEGEFDCFGFISLAPGLPAALRSWTYERLSEHSQRTVTCTATVEVPHGQDALVFQVLLELDRVWKRDSNRPLMLALTDIAQAIRGVYPELIIEEGLVYRSLLRLSDAVMTVKDVRTQPWSETTRIFSFLDSFTITGLSTVLDSSRDRLTLYINADMAELNRQRH